MVVVHRLLARDVHHVYRDTPDGLDLDHEVIDMVDACAKRGDGGWLVRVSYQLHVRDNSECTELITHYVPDHLVRRGSHGRRGRERSGLGH
jgi:hypothetical protein